MTVKRMSRLRRVADFSEENSISIQLNTPLTAAQIIVVEDVIQRWRTVRAIGLWNMS